LAKARWEAHVLALLVEKEFKLQYRGAFLGLLWALINPLLLMVVYTVMFSGILKVGIPNYPVFLLAGLIPWTFFSSGVNGATNSVVAHLPILRTHRLPTRLFPIAACLTSGLNLCVGLALFGFCRIFQGLEPGAVFWLLPVLAAQFLFTVGLGLGLAPLNALYRDTHQALLFFLRVWFFLTPIVYSTGQVPASFRPLIWANPMAGLVDAYRQVLLDGRGPDLTGLISALVCGAILGGLGLALDRRVAHRFPEIA